MSDVKIPTPGRLIVICPQTTHLKAGDELLDLNGAKELPAVVVQSWGNLIINANMFIPHNETPMVTLWSIRHESEKYDESQPYWKWPEIK